MDDFWLINILRGKYFNLLKSRTVNITETKEELLSLKTLLEELLTGSKNLISVWKRDHEYKEFVNDLYSDLVGDIKNSSDFKELAKTLPSLDNLQDEGFSGLQEIILSVLESQDKYEWSDFVKNFEEFLRDEITREEVRVILCADTYKTVSYTHLTLPTN